MPVDLKRGAPMITRSSDHKYTYEGITYPGVTTAIDNVGGSFNIASSWGAKQAAEAAIRLLPVLPAMVEELGPEGARVALCQKKNWTRDDAAQLGTDVHSLAEMVTHGKPLPESMSPRQRQRVEHYARWWETAGLTVRLTEAMIVRPGDDKSPGWGGTFDLLCYDADGRTVLSDVKTGRVYPKVALQLAAYGMASLVQPGGSQKVYPMPLPDRYTVIHVTEDGCKPIEYAIGSPERMAFLAALEIHVWLESQKGKLP